MLKKRGPLEDWCSRVRDHNERASKRVTVVAKELREAPAAAQKEAEQEEQGHAFACDEDDHAETPLDAYEDVVPFLSQVAKMLGKRNDELIVYDPYFCNGAVKLHLGQLGFPRVINENRDCYSDWEAREGVVFDVVVTNPPYSGDHMERMCGWLAKRRKPFAFVVPNFVVKKPYHRELVEPLRPFFIVPFARYVYLPPKGLRSKKKSDTQKKTAPWMSLWHCYGGELHHARLLDWALKTKWDARVRIARSRNALRDLRRK